MSAEDAITELNAIPRGDIEYSGAEADRIICELLTSLGYEAVVKAFDDVPRWYA